MTKLSDTIAAVGNKGKLTSIKKRPSRMMLLAVLLILVVGTGLTYFIRTRQAATTTTTSAPQTATVRQGDLLISVTGAGTLAAADEIELSFTDGGQVTGIFVKPGDTVEAGTLLAQVNATEVQINYTQAKQTYQELTSEGAIAAAQEQVAQAQAALLNAKYDLEYLISPEVLYWETEIANGEKTYDDAKSRVEASPLDEEAKQALKKANDYLVFAEGKLSDAWELYYDEYVPETFRLIEDGTDRDIYAVPTDLQIQVARTAIDDARQKLDESQEVYNVLTGAPMPQITSNDGLIAIQDAERSLQDAQEALDGTSIVAPIAGTILSVDTSVGSTVDISTVITMADLGQLELNFYLDETDWGMAAVGDQAEVTFDGLPDQTFAGQVTELDTELYQSGNTSAVKGIAQLGSALKGINLPIGSSATLDIIHARADNAVLVPIEALQETTPGKYTVFLVENGTLTQRAVTIGLQDQFYAEVKSGLQAGDVVSTQPTTAD